MSGKSFVHMITTHRFYLLLEISIILCALFHRKIFKIDIKKTGIWNLRIKFVGFVTAVFFVKLMIKSGSPRTVQFYKYNFFLKKKKNINHKYDSNVVLSKNSKKLNIEKFSLTYIIIISACSKNQILCIFVKKWII